MSSSFAGMKHLAMPTSVSRYSFFAAGVDDPLLHPHEPHRSGVARSADRNRRAGSGPHERAHVVEVSGGMVFVSADPEVEIIMAISDFNDTPAQISARS